MTPPLVPIALVELQAALQAGAGPAEALAATCGTGPLAAAARDARVGRPLHEIAAGIDTGDAGADLLVRSLALAERTGGGAVQAVEHALGALTAEADLQRLLDVRTAQARGTAVILAAVPVAAWTLLVALDVRTLRFYATPLGALTGAAAVLLALAAWRWMRRLTAATRRAAAPTDALAPSRSRGWRSALAGGVAAGAIAAAVFGPVAGAVAAVAVTAAGSRPRRAPDATAGPGTAEAVDLVAVALGTGLPAYAALWEVAQVAPPSLAEHLTAAARRVGSGWAVDEAFAGTPLVALGAALAAGQRWGAPAAPALRRLAAELRAQRRAAVEVAAERLQLTLVFPTTLLTLPAFVLSVVPPLLWSTLRA